VDRAFSILWSFSDRQLRRLRKNVQSCQDDRDIDGHNRRVTRAVGDLLARFEVIAFALRTRHAAGMTSSRPEKWMMYLTLCCVAATAACPVASVTC
jgi:hypothetical protein